MKIFENKFSVPFNGGDPDRFIAQVLHNQRYIRNIYLGHRQAFPQFHPYEPGGDERAERVMRVLADRVPILMTLNIQLPITADVPTLMDQWKTIDFLKRYGVAGVIAADPRVAWYVADALPTTLVYTSVNTPSVQLNDWPQLAAVQLPRSQTLSRSAADHWHALGQRVKVMLNEWCAVNCPNTWWCVKCACTGALDEAHLAIHEAKRTPFVTCQTMYHALTCPTVVLPRWSTKVAEWADELKIVGKNTPDDWVFNVMNLYIHGADNVTMGDLTWGFCLYEKGAERTISTAVYDDRQLSCEHRHCTNCNIREIVTKRLTTAWEDKDALLHMHRIRNSGDVSHHHL